MAKNNITYGELMSKEEKKNKAQADKNRQDLINLIIGARSAGQSIDSTTRSALGNFISAAMAGIGGQVQNAAAYPGVIASTPVGQIPRWGGQNPQVAQNPIFPQAQAAGPSVPQLPRSPVASYAPTQPAQQQSPVGGKSSKSDQSGYITHVVQPGDTLWGIAQQYMGNGDNWHQLKGFNFHNDPKFLQPGTQIHVPVASMQQSKQQTYGPGF